MRHVCAELAWPGQPDQGVEVGPVHVHLAARLVHHLAHLRDGLLEHPVGGRVGQHDGGHVSLVGRQLGPQVREVDRAVRAAFHHGYPQSCENRARGVGAMGRLRDQAHIAPGLAPRGVIGPDGQQACQLAL